MRLLKRFLLSLLIIASHAAYAAAGDDDKVGMILDVQGAVKLTDKEKTRKVDVLTYLKPNMQLTLDAGSKASITIYAGRLLYIAEGPAVIQVEAGQLKTLQGKPPVAKTVAEKLITASANSNFVLGGYQMRRFVPRVVINSPQNGELLLTERPSFEWTAAEATTYDLAIQDANGKAVFGTKLADKTWALPASVRLLPNTPYQISISYTAAKDRQVHTASSDFTIAGKSEADQLKSLKPAEGASIEEWLLYATTVQGRQAYQEADAAWHLIFSRRPDLKRIHE